MPIHTSWKSMAEGMRRTYAGQGKTKCRPFTDGTKVCMSQKAWQVFFATINKMGADETKPRPHSKSTQESRKVVEWFIESTLKSSDLPPHSIPKWINLAQKVLKSPKLNEKVKAYWKKRLMAWCKENPKSKVCEG